MARIKQVEVGYTYNMGNFESLRLAMVEEMDDGEVITDLSSCIKELKQKLDIEAQKFPRKGR